MSEPMTPEEVTREWVGAAERSEWLKEARQSLEHALTDLNSYGGARYFAEDYGAGLLDYVDTLRAYIQEKNEIIRAFAGPTGMTPEDVAYLRERVEKLETVLSGIRDDARGILVWEPFDGPLREIARMADEALSRG